MSVRPEGVHPLVRRLKNEDLDRIMEIELATYPFPWTRGIFADCLRVGYDCWGIQLGGTLVGYAIQNHVAGENHLLNLCIESECQRQGFGKMLLDHIVRLARRQACFCIFLEVRPSNKAAVALYQKNNFKIVSERPNYYQLDEGRESAIVMRLDLET